jgi:uncharacterized protein (TIGR03437 family)
MTINGVGCGLKYVSRHQIVFVVPPALSSAATGTVYPVVINNNGVVFKGNITIVRARPDIFTTRPDPGPLGRALAFNVTNRVHTTEPFSVATVQIRGGRRVPSLIRLRLTGVQGATAATIGTIRIRIGGIELTPNLIETGAVLVEPGVYTIDFRLPFSLNGAGDQPIIVTITDAQGNQYSSRLDDTAPRIAIL